jgi:hypothetical protein
VTKTPESQDQIQDEKPETEEVDANPGNEILGMSDEDFLKNQTALIQTHKRVDEGKADEKPADIQDNPPKDIEDNADEPGDDAASDAKPEKSGTEEKPVPAQSAKAKDDTAKDGNKSSEQTPEEKAGKTTKPVVPVPGSEEKKPDAEQKPVDYEAFFKQVMTPFKANNKTITLNTPEEAIRLMQMGAGYGRKLQELQPHLKTIRMLEKHNLLDPDQLSYLIDLRDRNPDAIRKLVKDSGIDPLDLNTEEAVSYKPTSRAISDSEMSLHEALDDVKVKEGGLETLTAIQGWDQESINMLSVNPKVIDVIHRQREMGVYDQITDQMEKMKLLGVIPRTTPFLQAYKEAGDYIEANGGFKLAPAKTNGLPTEPAKADPKLQQPVEIRTATPKPQVANSAKAAAASSTKTNDKKPSQVINPLSMPDDEFMKTFANRLGG